LKKAKNILICVLLCVLSAAGVELCLFLAGATDSLNRIDTLAGQASVTIANVAQLSANLQRDQVSTQAQIKGAAHEARQSMMELRRVLYVVNTATLPQFNKDNHALMLDLDTTVMNTDTALIQLSRQTTASIKNFDQGTQQLVASTVEAETAASKLLADPVMVANMRQASIDLQKSTAHLVPIMTDLEAEQHDVRGYVHRLTKPATTAMTVLTKLGEYGAMAGGAFLGVVR